MSVERVFLDTNVLVYAFDRSAGFKHERASALVQDLWQSGTGSVSTQVLQEFSVIVTRKIPKPLSVEQTEGIVRDMLQWEVVVNDGAALLEAFEILKKYQFSFWDALIVSAAVRSGAHTLYSEDLSHSQKVLGILIENPFRN
jgi:predicted nucleic acid-binding protein